MPPFGFVPSKIFSFPASAGGTSSVRFEQRTANGVREHDGVYIRDVSTKIGGELRFQNMPTEIQDNKSANYSATTILGRSEPIQGYADSGPRVISFALDFAESVDQGDNPTNGAGPSTLGGNVEQKRTDYVRSCAHWLQSLVYPDYDDKANGLVKPPPVCLLIIGETIRSRGIFKDVSTTWKGPWEPESITPLLANVSLTFEEVNEASYSDGPWSYREVRLMQNFAKEAIKPNKFQALT